MGRLDRYVGRIVAGWWISCLVFLLFITILLDLLNFLPVYLQQADKLGMGGLFLYLATYYLQFIPGAFVTVSPFVTVIACMFAVTRLMASQELHPMLFAGRSMFRVLRPVLLAGALAGAGMAACWEWVLPNLGESFSRSRDVLRGEGPEAAADQEGKAQNGRKLPTIVLPLEGSSSRKLFVLGYHAGSNRMFGVNLLIESPSAEAQLVQAKTAVWDAGRGDWRLEEGKVAWGIPPADHVAPREWLQEPTLLPDVVARAGRETVDTEFLSYGELIELGQLRHLRADVKMTLHRRITFPLANVVLLLLALPVTIHFERKSRVGRLLGAILFCGAYLLTDLTCQSMGRGGYVHPVVAAWAPVILFGSLGVVMFQSQKT